MLQFLLPLNEIIVDFHDSLKRVSSGYASFDYEEYGYEPSNITKVIIIVLIYIIIVLTFYIIYIFDIVLIYYML